LTETEAVLPLVLKLIDNCYKNQRQLLNDISRIIAPAMNIKNAKYSARSSLNFLENHSMGTNINLKDQ